MNTLIWNGLELPDKNIYFKNEDSLIYCADNREILPLLPDKSVDLVLTSPPFNQAWGGKHHTGSQWEQYYEDDLPEDVYQQQQMDILNMLWDIVKQDGSMWYQHKNRIRYGISIPPYEWLLKTRWIIKQEIVWFNRSQNFDKRRFYPMTERLYWLAKSVDTELTNIISKHDDWHITPEGANGDFKRAFPEELVNRILVCFPKSNIILDPYLGSGTTTYCAKKLNRKCIGIEIKEQYCEIAVKRLRQGVMRLDK